MNISIAPNAGAHIDRAALGAAARVRAILSLPDDRLDYGVAKLAFDAIIDPAQDTRATLAELDRMTEIARDLAGPSPTDDAKLAALRTLIYESGPWNGHRPFSYDHAHPQGQNIRNKLLPVYLQTRRGNCVSMPILFLILAEKLGLDVALASAPLHLFVRYQEESGRIINLETTSGAQPARSLWYRQNMPMSDHALKNGLYLRSLPRREAAAHMASTILEHLIGTARYQEAIEVAETIIEHAPRNAYVLVKLGTACAYLMQVEFVDKYPAPWLIPHALQAHYVFLVQRNFTAFQTAEALGWEPPREE